jgi:hypothetical protein
MLKKNKEDFMKVFETRDLGEAKEYLGMHCYRPTLIFPDFSLFFLTF